MKFVPSRTTKKKLFDIQRRVVANKTLEGWREAPHAAVQLDLDVDAVLDWLRRAKENPAYTGVRLTLNAVLLKLIANALRFAPDLNAHISYSPLASVGSITCFEEVNIAVPFRSTDSRMITPVVRDVAAKSLAAVCSAMEDLARRGYLVSLGAGGSCGGGCAGCSAKAACHLPSDSSRAPGILTLTPSGREKALAS